MNKIISRTCAMLAEGKSLKDVAAFLDPVRGVPSRHPNCVVVEAWNVAMRQAAKGQRAKPAPRPPKGERVERVHKIFRAEHRNHLFGRPDVGNRQGGVAW